MFLVIVAEFFGSLGLILGCLSRIAAFSIAVDMTVAAITTTSHFGMFINWSGKQKGEGMEFQVLMIAMALLPRPDLIIADEPTTALDVTIQAQILKLLRALVKERGVSVLFTTHDLGTAHEI